tara:strand:+ start:44 stop:289 length:246 start_codon:yes stop_codon:yes gene_type:complete
MTETPVEKISQEQMLSEFKERFQKLITENQQLGQKIKENESQALKLQGAIETLEYYLAKEGTPDTPEPRPDGTIDPDDIDE